MTFGLYGQPGGECSTGPPVQPGKRFGPNVKVTKFFNLLALSTELGKLFSTINRYGFTIRILKRFFPKFARALFCEECPI